MQRGVSICGKLICDNERLMNVLVMFEINPNLANKIFKMKSNVRIRELVVFYGWRS